jgi:quercetin dioxygenase-like cupin family protein
VTINNIAPDTSIIRHTHPGIESSYVLEGGGFDLRIKGRPTRMVKAGNSFQIPPETPHAGVKNGDKKPGSRLLMSSRKGSR